MAKLDYWAIREEVRQRILAAHPEYVVELEREVQFSVEQNPWICIYIEQRNAPGDAQRLSAGTRIRYRIPVKVWVWFYALEWEQAIRGRDTVLANVEYALIGTGTLSELVDFSWVEGGRMISGRVANEAGAADSFLSGAELILMVEVTMSL